jgi:uroporphyrinogen-III synthase
MKTFKQFLEQSLPSNYTDYKAPAVQTAHARSMGSASRMRQMGMNATAVDPKDDAQSNLDAVKSGNGVAKPLSGTTIKSGAGKGFKVGDPGINIGPSK